MTTAKINVCVDAQTKAAVEALLDEMGLTMTAAINIYLKRILLERGIPFELSTVAPNSDTVAALREYDAMKNDPGSYKRYATFKDAMKETLGDA